MITFNMVEHIIEKYQSCLTVFIRKLPIIFGYMNKKFQRGPSEFLRYVSI